MTLVEGKSPSTTGKGKLGMRLVGDMERITLDRIGKTGLENAKRNLRHIDQGKSLKSLRDIHPGQGDKAIVIAAGPSLHRTDVAAKLMKYRFKGAVITTDSAMRYCLRHGIIPDLVVTLDPHPKRIVRWFGDPGFSKHDLEEDDYFSRQDMDPAFQDEIRVNEEILELLDKYGRGIRLALSTSASEAVVNRAVEIGMEIFWWNPMYDDPDDTDGITMRLYRTNGLPCVNAGGNVGSACWMMAHAVLGKRRVAVTGMDLSYYAGTPYKNTQYYREAVDLVGEDNLDSLYIPIKNPHLDQWFYSDPAYMWYRQCLLEMVADADCVTYNCTEGGILFGNGIHFVPLHGFLSMDDESSVDVSNLESTH